LKIPVIGADLGVTQGSTESLSNGETTTQSSVIETSYSLPLTVPANRKQTLTGTMKTTSATVKVPVRYNLIYSRNEVEEANDVVTFSTTGLVAGTSADIQLKYGAQTPC